MPLTTEGMYTATNDGWCTCCVLCVRCVQTALRDWERALAGSTRDHSHYISSCNDMCPECVCVWRVVGGVLEVCDVLCVSCCGWRVCVYV